MIGDLLAAGVYGLVQDQIERADFAAPTMFEVFDDALGDAEHLAAAVQGDFGDALLEEGEEGETTVGPRRIRGLALDLATALDEVVADFRSRRDHIVRQNDPAGSALPSWTDELVGRFVGMSTGDHSARQQQLRLHLGRLLVGDGALGENDLRRVFAGLARELRTTGELLGLLGAALGKGLDRTATAIEDVAQALARLAVPLEDAAEGGGTR